MAKTQPTAVLLVICPDQTGLIANVTQFIHANNGNIVHLDQHVDAESSTFLMRMEWELKDFWIPREHIAERFLPIAARFNMRSDLHFSDDITRMAVLVSKEGHCLHDILAQWSGRQWPAELALVISNHRALEPVITPFGVPFAFVEVTADTKPQAEAQQLALLAEHRVDLVVLARYMQVLSPTFVERYQNRIINSHQSVLPAFAGAKPYHAAHARGVKLIGATSHYVTAELDAGPIIEQDTTRVGPKDSVQDLVRRGRDLEKTVLSRAVWYHLNHRVLVNGHKTFVFG